MTYVGPSQVLVKPLNTDADDGTSAGGVILKSQYGHEIEDVRVMGEDRYLIGRTRDTLLLGEQLVNDCACPSVLGNDGPLRFVHAVSLQFVRRERNYRRFL